MAKQRYINTRFWRDSYIEDLDPVEKLLFIYLLTNPDTNISGIYEIPLKIIAVDTGIDKDMLKKLLKRFEDDKKIKYKNGWIAIKNFTNHQTISPKIKIGIEKELKNAPIDMVSWINLNQEIKYIYPIEEVSDLNSNTNTNINTNLNKNTNAQPPRHKYGTYKNILLTDEQHLSLSGEYSAEVITHYIEQMSAYCESHGKTYKNYYAAIKNWIKRDKQTPAKKQSVNKNADNYNKAKELLGI